MASHSTCPDMVRLGPSPGPSPGSSPYLATADWTRLHGLRLMLLTGTRLACPTRPDWSDWSDWSDWFHPAPLGPIRPTAWLARPPCVWPGRYQGMDEHRNVPRSQRLMRVLFESIEDIFLLSLCDTLIAQVRECSGRRRRLPLQRNAMQLCNAMRCYAMLCYAMLCYAMLCYAMLCYAMLCYAMLC